MLKKIIIGAVITGVLGFVIFGAVNRTLAKTTGTSLLHQYPQTGLSSQGGRSWNSNGNNTTVRDASEVTGGNQGNRNASESTGGNWGNQDIDETTGGYRGNRSGNAVDQTDANFVYGQGQADATEWIELDGVVTSADETSLLITATDGQTIEIYGRAWTYALDYGFNAVPGDTVHMNGFYDTNDVYEVGQITNQNNDLTVSLRSETGRPNWAGGNGNRGGR